MPKGKFVKKSEAKGKVQKGKFVKPKFKMRSKGGRYAATDKYA